MGDDWHSRIHNDPDCPPTDVCQEEVILRPSIEISDIGHTQATSKDNPAVIAEERAHSLRMRRCGAVAICAQDDIRHYDAEQMNMAPKYLFDWPASGGVWVLWPPWKQAALQESKDHPRTDEDIMNDMMESARRDEVYHALAEKANQQEDVEDVSPAIEDSPEAVELEHVDL